LARSSNEFHFTRGFEALDLFLSVDNPTADATKRRTNAAVPPLLKRSRTEAEAASDLDRQKIRIIHEDSPRSGGA
jgi:hypothetical protein